MMVELTPSELRRLITSWTDVDPHSTNLHRRDQLVMIYTMMRVSTMGDKVKEGLTMID